MRRGTGRLVKLLPPLLVTLRRNIGRGHRDAALPELPPPLRAALPPKLRGATPIGV